MKKKTRKDLFSEVFSLPAINVLDDFKHSHFLQKVYTACHKNKMNQIILVTGLPRTGKSELCLWLAYQLDRGKNGEHLFNPREQVAFDISTCTKLIDEFDKPGRVIVWEEAGVAGHGANARKWQQDENIQLNNVFQIMGLKRQIVIINLPAQFFLDKGVRSMAHWQIFTEKVNVGSNVCLCRIRQVRLLPEKNDVRYLKLVYFDKRLGRVMKEKASYIPRPPYFIRKEYYALEKENKPKWIKEAQAAIDKSKANVGKDNRVGVKAHLGENYEDVVSNPDMYWDSVKNKPDISAIMVKLGLDRFKAYAIANVWKKEVSGGFRNV